jgi:two-component system OmpR family sensor kinase
MAQPGGGPAAGAELERLLHDLRGPLNSASMYVEVLRRAVKDDPAADDTLRRIGDQLDRLAGMLPAAFSILALERRAAEPVDLEEMVAALRADGTVGPVTVAGAPWPVALGDRDLLAAGLGQVLRNAVEVGGPRPPEVSAVREGDRVRLSVRDWGPGLRSTNPKVMIRLQQSDKPGHAGLGLLVAERVARLHGGRLELAAAPDGPGAVVAFTLPAA